MQFEEIEILRSKDSLKVYSSFLTDVAAGIALSISISTSYIGGG